jgi:hypothetical protein
MSLRLAGLLGLVVLAASSSACTYKTQTQVREVPVDYSDYAFYDRAYGASPTYAGASGQAVAHAGSSDAAPVADGAASDAPRREPSRGHANDAGNAALGFTAGGAQRVTTETSSVEYEQVEATPGTACYEAAVKAGIQSGVCTLVSERKYVLVGEKAR